jgi:hypothetical protein
MRCTRKTGGRRCDGRGMVETKMIEVRDRDTFIPCLAIKLSASCDPERYLLARVGYRTAEIPVVLMQVSTLRATDRPHEWGDLRTMPAAHRWIVEHFDEIEDGQVVDVQFILGERPSPTLSERDEPGW